MSFWEVLWYPFTKRDMDDTEAAGCIVAYIYVLGGIGAMVYVCIQVLE